MTARGGAGADGERLLVRTEDGRLFDALTRRPVTLEGLAGEVRRGGRFRVGEGGGECTYQVLAQVLLTALAPARPGAARTAGRPPGPVAPPPDAPADARPPVGNG